MSRPRHFAALCTLGVLMPAAAVAIAQEASPRDVPARGSVPYGKVVYVDDGSCPPGEIKEIRGGSKERGVARQVRCVTRPELPMATPAPATTPAPAPK